MKFPFEMRIQPYTKEDPKIYGIQRIQGNTLKRGGGEGC
jgi:hypothetical protein